MRRTFMSTPEQLASLEGQQYLVLRPVGPVAEDFAGAQEHLLNSVPVPHPHTGHVTLRGFYEPDRLEQLAALIRTWGASQHPIEITAEAIDSFPAPWQIVIVRLTRTASLVSAYASLTETLDATDFRRLGELSLDDWTFHLSLVYGKTLGADAWAELERTARREYSEVLGETVVEAELVWYAGGVEHAEVIPLG